MCSIGMMFNVKSKIKQTRTMSLLSSGDRQIQINAISTHTTILLFASPQNLQRNIPEDCI